ncbi:hypothetical protein [Desulfolutivibrio sulfoxidireducens]|uniref:hypothetical protein n=1 Tax=Desulfolutivibrio sulfoxidireducens TaxID=2773299 RepID=UPI00159D5D89|nr:hypothetical protein [Desulfolutivibrio sulfoxidireducens]QLA15415.1 hypothetical protein GD605_04300 [Desulfolutivibrio sulfoxidireducens]QLA19012.1 hypothetical protein GD604_04325 [Desulfolutivibrio sulfoxidireducens]
MLSVHELSTIIFDPLHAFWERTSTKRAVACLQVAVFLAGILGIELNRRGLLPPSLAAVTPLSHYYAISLAFTLVLIQEVIDLIFILPCSVSKSVGKQFEILCLILIRNAFKELVHFSEPISLSGGIAPVLPILADGVGALGIFFGLGWYYRLHAARPSGSRGADLFAFVAAKKLLSLLLLPVFASLGVVVGFSSLADGQPHVFFEVFYTVLIFSDILIVLVSHAYQPNFHAVFRNSGFALVTLLIRLALAAPPFLAPGLGVTSMAIAIGLSAAYNAFAPAFREHGAPRK